jgi:catechol 2,3-dioxygenase-like lactoylglutathione lyase family enzyme
VRAKSFDHVAVWTAERDAVADLLTECCDMHVIERTDEFTLVGGDAREGKLTLFGVEGERDPGMLERILIRVPDLASTRRRLEERSVRVESVADGSLTFLASGEVPVGVLEDPSRAYGDLYGVVLGVAAPATTATALAPLVQSSANGSGLLEIAGRHIVLTRAGRSDDGPPMLNHIALLIDDVQAVTEEARARGLEIDREVDAPNTRAVFVVGPDGLVLEYVEHKPGFSLV